MMEYHVGSLQLTADVLNMWACQYHPSKLNMNALGTYSANNRRTAPQPDMDVCIQQIHNIHLAVHNA